jgi:hypothetical protein
MTLTLSLGILLTIDKKRRKKGYVLEFLKLCEGIYVL